jgi:biopolymer transport protein ExbD
MAGAANDENPVAINVVAMVDIIFCLCLFFMCSLKFRALDAKFETWLPREHGVIGPQAEAVRDEIRVLLSWDQATGSTERVFGQRRVPAGQDSDDVLVGLIREEARAQAARGVGTPTLIIDSGPQVPWAHVVAVLDLAKDSGVGKIEFGAGTAIR